MLIICDERNVFSDERFKRPKLIIFVNCTKTKANLYGNKKTYSGA